MSTAKRRKLDVDTASNGSGRGTSSRRAATGATGKGTGGGVAASGSGLAGTAGHGALGGGGNGAGGKGSGLAAGLSAGATAGGSGGGGPSAAESGPYVPVVSCLAIQHAPTNADAVRVRVLASSRSPPSPSQLWLATRCITPSSLRNPSRPLRRLTLPLPCPASCPSHQATTPRRTSPCFAGARRSYQSAGTGPTSSPSPRGRAPRRRYRARA